MARLPGNPRLSTDPTSLGAARLLAVRNAQLTAVARARSVELIGSRRQIVETAEQEGRRMERDLHDGAQQRLVSSALYLAIARQTQDQPNLTLAEAKISQALSQLRAIAHGFAPETLRTRRVWAAIDDLASAAIPVEVDMPIDPHGDDDANAALYFAIQTTLDAAAAASAHSVLVTGTNNPHALCATIGVRGALLAPDEVVDATDRVGALDGNLHLTTSGDGCLIELEVPCAS